MNERMQIGILGEEQVIYTYRKNKYNIVAQNYRCRFGEIDVIVEKNNTLVVCEVKTRKQGSLTLGREAVNFEKQRKVIKATKMFLAENQFSDTCVRFDVAEVTYDSNRNFEVEIIENAFFE